MNRLTIFAVLAASGALALQSVGAATPTPTPSPTPANVGSSFNVAWTDDSNPAGTVDGYWIKYGSASGTYTTTVDVKAPTKTKDFSAMPTGTIYLVVMAYNGGGDSKPTAEVRINVIGVPNAPGTPVITNLAGGGMANVSTRGEVAPGDAAMIGGFIISEAEKVAVRAIGPSLLQYGIKDPLSKATVELHDASGATIRANDGWENGPDADELRELKLSPGSVNESALIADLAAGAYTAVVRGGPEESGIGLVEVYALP